MSVSDIPDMLRMHWGWYLHFYYATDCSIKHYVLISGRVKSPLRWVSIGCWGCTKSTIIHEAGTYMCISYLENGPCFCKWQKKKLLTINGL